MTGQLTLRPFTRPCLPVACRLPHLPGGRNETGNIEAPPANIAEVVSRKVDCRPGPAIRINRHSGSRRVGGIRVRYPQPLMGQEFWAPSLSRASSRYIHDSDHAWGTMRPLRA